MILKQLKDLYTHMEWADACIWETVLASPTAAADDQVLDTLMHIHETQHAFGSAWTDGTFRRWTRDEFATAQDMADWGRSFHAPATEFIATLTEDDLNRDMILLWARYFARTLGHEAAGTTLGETLFQVVNHSTHHRAQVCRRLRELNLDPPTVDYIVWLWRGRPAVEWSAGVR